MDFMKELLSQTDDAETPRTWVRWAGLMSIAAVSAFNVSLDKYYYKLSPNIYALLIGKSGLGKALPIHIAKQLVETVDNTRIISGRNSIEAVILELSRTRSRENKPMIADSRGFLVSGEFSNFIISNPQALTIITEWYDTHYLGEWSNTLKSTGVEKLKGVNITMFGACSPPHFRDFVTTRDIEGGFVGRTMLIYAEKRYKINSLVDKPDIELDLTKLADYMKQVSQVKGEFKWSSEGKRAYKDWYTSLRQREEQHSYNGDRTVTDQRIQDHVCKVAMLLSLSHNTDLILQEEDINEAIKLCTQFVSDAKKANLNTAGKSALAEQTGVVLTFLMKYPTKGASREEILKRYWNDMDAFDLDKIEMTLLQAGAITAESEGDDKVYKLTDKYLKQVEAYTEKKKKASKVNGT